MDLKQYIECLHARRQVLEVDSLINGRLELAALTDLLCKRGGPGLLFNKVQGTRLALVSNLFGSDQRMATALGHESLSAFGNWMTAAISSAAGDSSAECLQHLLQKINNDSGTVTRIEREANLGFLPQLRYWPEERRTFLTLAVIVSRAPESNIQNYGLYRVGVEDNKSLTLNLLPGSGAGEHLKLWSRQGKLMPIAILLGADPAMVFAAAAPLPNNCSEESFSTFIHRSTSNSSTCCLTVPLSVPSSAQIVIEGLVDPQQLVNEGPFGSYSGDYGGSNDCPLVRVSAVTMVEEPLMPVTVAGPLPMEDCWIARANLELIRARLSVDLPEVSAIEMPLVAAFHGLYFVRCENLRVSAEQLAKRLRKLDYLRHLKLLILQNREDEVVSDSNWRGIMKNLSADQIWQDPYVQLDDLLNDNPAKLQHDQHLIKSLLERLATAGIEIPIE